MLAGWVRSLFKFIGIFFSLLATVGVAAYITIVILVPPEEIVVPNVVGKKVEEAVMLLSQRKLSTRVAGKKFSREIPENVVLSQTPAPGTKVRKGRIVELVVSEGAKLVTVPNLVGMKLREARMHLSQFGVKVASTSYVPSEIMRDEVIAQDPCAGAKMDRERGVNLLVSSGPLRPKVMMPDLRGEKIKKISQQLKNTPLNIAMIKEQVSPEEEGTIIFQSPPPGSMVDENSRVELVVSAGEEERPGISVYQRWVLIPVQIPPGLGEKKLQIIIIDREGRRGFEYGVYSGGEKVWISCDVVGRGEVRVYIDNKLVKIEKVEG